MKNKSVIIFILFALVMVQCSEKKQQQEQVAVETADVDTAKVTGATQFEVVPEFQQQLSGLFAAYVLLKESLVASDMAQVKRQAEAAQQALKKVDMHLLSGPAHQDWMTYSAGLEANLDNIQKAADLEAQRTAFSTLSDNLYKSIKAYGVGSGKVYYDFCPMAFNNKGGYWLSDQEQIRNPYFGDQMLTCGSIRETLR